MGRANVILWHEYDLNKTLTESKTEFMKNEDNYFRGRNESGSKPKKTTQKQDCNGTCTLVTKLNTTST